MFLLHTSTTRPPFIPHRAFAEPSFDAAQFASRVVNADSAMTGGGAFSAALSDGGADPEGRSHAEITMGDITAYVSHIDCAIQEHVTTHQEQLLDGVGSIHELQTDCHTLDLAVRDVKRSVRSISQDIAMPFHHIQLRALQLKRVHAASLLLKRVLNIQMTALKLRALEPLLGLQAMSKIRAGTASAADLAEVDLRELSKAAETLWEVEALLHPIGKGGEGARRVQVVAAEVPFIRKMGGACRVLAAAKLREGLRSLNQADIGGALQVFHNLGQLPERIGAAVEAVNERISDRIAGAFSVASLHALAGKGADGTKLLT